MYFCLVHATGDQAGRISAPPPCMASLPVPPSPSPSPRSPRSPGPPPVTDGAGGAEIAPFAGDGKGDGGGRDDSEKGGTGVRKGGVVVESEDDQVFRFWDDETNGELVQAPLELDRQGRGWSQV